MQALSHYIVIRKIKEEPKRVAGLIVTEEKNTELRYLKAEIVSVGDLVQHEKIVPGAIVLYDRHAGNGIQWDDEFLHVVRLPDIASVE